MRQNYYPVDIKITAGSGASLGVYHRNMFVVLLQQARPIMTSSDSYTIPVAWLRERTGLKCDVSTCLVLEELARATIHFHDIKTRITGCGSLVQYARDFEEVRFRFPAGLHERLAESAFWPQLLIRMVMEIKGHRRSHAVFLYEFLSPCGRGSHIRMSTEDLREMLGLQRSSRHQSSVAFYEVLSKTITEMNAYTDLRVRLTPVKQGQKVAFLVFQVKRGGWPVSPREASDRLVLGDQFLDIEEEFAGRGP